MLVFAVLLSECFGLRWYSLHTHEQANTSVKSHTTYDFFSREGVNVFEYQSPVNLGFEDAKSLEMRSSWKKDWRKSMTEVGIRYCLTPIQVHFGFCTANSSLFQVYVVITVQPSEVHSHLRKTARTILQPHSLILTRTQYLSHPINYPLSLDPFALLRYYGSKGLNKRTLSSSGKLFRESMWNLVSLEKVCADGPGDVRCDADVFIRTGRCIVSSCTI